jgi:hypothetical protein
MTRVLTDPAQDDAAADRQDCRQPESDSHGEAVMDGSLTDGYVRYNVCAGPREADGNSAAIFVGHGAGGSNTDRRTEQKKKRTVL